jgi:hypothetical protein
MILNSFHVIKIPEMLKNFSLKQVTEAGEFIKMKVCLLEIRLPS